jgi:hypothetical protein
LTLGLAASARAGSTFVVSPPVIDRGEITFLLGGISEEGATLRPSSVEAELDGVPAAPPQSLQAFVDFAQSAAEADPRWKSPLAVGLVYLWIKEVPTAVSDAVLQGVTGLLQRLPARTSAYATLYGRKRQPIPKLKASDLGATLHDLAFLGGDRPNLAEAIRLDLRNLLSDESPGKLLLVVTDGRDFTDATGEGPADFSVLSSEIARAGVRLFLLSFPASDADVEQSASNLADTEPPNNPWSCKAPWSHLDKPSRTCAACGWRSPGPGAFSVGPTGFGSTSRPREDHGPSRPAPSLCRQPLGGCLALLRLWRGCWFFWRACCSCAAGARVESRRFSPPYMT